jgi:radical SAM superfamily enzyme YgiQ (UPF0313 family)
MLPPDEIIIRPPVEAYSVLIPVTGGCSWNRCRFCGVYKGIQEYAILPLDRVLQYIDHAAAYSPEAPYVYLAGGNPTSAPTEYLVAILRHVKSRFRYVKRISCYAKALDIIRKSDAELQALATSGLSIVYMGLESGSDTVLSFMKKGTTSKTITTAAHRLMATGIQVSLYVILGLGGKKWTQLHAQETAKVLNAIRPTIFRFRTLNVLENSPLAEDIAAGTFETISPLEILIELRAILAGLDPTLASKMRNDHISNYINLESENIGQDRDKFLKILDDLIADPRTAELRPKNLKSM